MRFSEPLPDRPLIRAANYAGAQRLQLRETTSSGSRGFAVPLAPPLHLLDVVLAKRRSKLSIGQSESVPRRHDLGRPVTIGGGSPKVLLGDAAEPDDGAKRASGKGLWMSSDGHAVRASTRLRTLPVGLAGFSRRNAAKATKHRTDLVRGQANRLGVPMPRH